MNFGRIQLKNGKILWGDIIQGKHGYHIDTTTGNRYYFREDEVKKVFL